MLLERHTNPLSPRDHRDWRKRKDVELFGTSLTLSGLPLWDTIVQRRHLPVELVKIK